MNNKQNYFPKQDKSFSNKTPKVVGATALTLVGMVMFYTLVISPSKDSSSAYHSSTSSNNSNSSSNVATNNSSNSNTSSNTSSNSSSNSTGTTYTDGQYSSDINYSVPHGQNTISVTLSISGDTVTNVTVDDSYSDRESGQYIGSFESSIKSKVVGKKISGISLSRVGGASLTTNAFNRALSDIKNQAS